MNSKDQQESIGVFSLWAIGVGLVISGESFGWNIGWGITGANTFFIPVLIAACLYFCLVKVLIELTSMYPESEGPHKFVEMAFGKILGNFFSYIFLFELVIPPNLTAIKSRG